MERQFAGSPSTDESRTSQAINRQLTRSNPRFVLTPPLSIRNVSDDNIKELRREVGEAINEASAGHFTSGVKRKSASSSRSFAGRPTRRGCRCWLMRRVRDSLSKGSRDGQGQAQHVLAGLQGPDDQRLAASLLALVLALRADDHAGG